mgnify:CR=1 FL=1
MISAMSTCLRFNQSQEGGAGRLIWIILKPSAFIKQWRIYSIVFAQNLRAVQWSTFVVSFSLNTSEAPEKVSVVASLIIHLGQPARCSSLIIRGFKDGQE